MFGWLGGVRLRDGLWGVGRGMWSSSEGVGWGGVVVRWVVLCGKHDAGEEAVTKGRA